MTMPKPDKFGIYPAPTWRLSNPEYETGEPKHHRDGVHVTVDAGLMWDAAQLGQTNDKGKKK